MFNVIGNNAINVSGIYFPANNKTPSKTSDAFTDWNKYPELIKTFRSSLSFPILAGRGMKFKKPFNPKMK
jgi:hypothetical protein